jgi:hypothetical protein
MKQQLARLTVLLAVCAPVYAQSFVNLDFESASTAGATPPLSLLPWDSAAPGWGHSDGADTDFVFYGASHVGVTQWFLLVDESNSDGLLVGNYAMRYASGYSSSSLGSSWVFAYLSQSGMVPLDAKSLRFFSRGPLAVQINGAALPITSTGDQSYALDIASFAGTEVEIRFINTSSELFNSVTLDAVAFSASPVPELPAWGMMLLGLVAMRGARLSRAAVRPYSDA